MPLPNGYEVRPATRADAEAITEMFVEQEVRLSGEAESSPEDLYDDWSGPGFEMERDTWVVTSGDEVVGYAGIVKTVPPATFAAYGGVRPSHMGRGVGTFLFEAVEERVVQKGDGSGIVRQWIDANDKVGIGILMGRGYGFVRRFWRMDLPLDGDHPAPEPIEGITIRPFQKGVDERAAHDVNEAAFAEHWGFSPKTYEQAAVSRWDAEWFRADLSLVAEADGRMVAICINGTRFDDGFVEDLGVIKEYRGRGIGETLLLQSFHNFKELGLKRASLNVDSDNSSGAMRLYERVGMRTGTCYDIYERQLS